MSHKVFNEDIFDVFPSNHYSTNTGQDHREWGSCDANIIVHAIGGEDEMFPVNSEVWVRCDDDNDLWPAVVLDSSSPQYAGFLDGDTWDMVIKLFLTGIESPVHSRDVRLIEWEQMHEPQHAHLFGRSKKLKKAVSRAFEHYERRTGGHQSAPRPTNVQSQRPHNETVAAVRKRERSQERLPIDPQPRPLDDAQAPGTTDDGTLEYSESEINVIMKLAAALGPDASEAVIKSYFGPSGLPKQKSRSVVEHPVTVKPAAIEQKPAMLKEGKPERAPSQVIPSAVLASQSSLSRLSSSSAPPVASQPAPNGVHPAVTVELLEGESIEILQQEVFEGGVVLDPVYKFVSLLGAVAIRAPSSQCVMPTRSFVYDNRHRATDRVMLVAVGLNYDTSYGWMERVPWLDNTTLEMRILVNNHIVPIPNNWRLPASRQQDAVRTLIPIDITDIIECTLPGEEGFQLKVHFVATGGPHGEQIVRNLQMWEAFIVCVLVKESSIQSVCEEIRSTFRNPALPKSSVTGIECAAEEVRLQCPITSQLMTTPCRGIQCDHFQCLELTSVVQQCCRSHVWNCPQCGGKIPPGELVVDYGLMEILQRVNVAEVERVVISVGRNGKQVYDVRRRKQRVMQETVLDDDDD